MELFGEKVKDEIEAKKKEGKSQDKINIAFYHTIAMETFISFWVEAFSKVLKPVWSEYFTENPFLQVPYDEAIWQRIFRVKNFDKYDDLDDDDLNDAYYQKEGFDLLPFTAAWSKLYKQLTNPDLMATRDPLRMVKDELPNNYKRGTFTTTECDAAYLLLWGFLSTASFDIICRLLECGNPVFEQTRAADKEQANIYLHLFVQTCGAIVQASTKAWSSYFYKKSLGAKFIPVQHHTEAVLRSKTVIQFHILLNTLGGCTETFKRFGQYPKSPFLDGKRWKVPTDQELFRCFIPEDRLATVDQALNENLVDGLAVLKDELIAGVAKLQALHQNESTGWPLGGRLVSDP